ncbi:hypothetical protein EDD11_007542 [Mortierella claussenii]|nr:hypothetical protein EDD11_007542 [Mortierella claussenii]
MDTAAQRPVSMIASKAPTIFGFDMSGPQEQELNQTRFHQPQSQDMIDYIKGATSTIRTAVNITVFQSSPPQQLAEVERPLYRTKKRQEAIHRGSE